MIPIIDLTPYYDGSDKAAVAAQIGRACEEIGFFTVSNHGIPLDLITSVNQAGQQFFDQPFATKREMETDGGMGYIGPSGEQLAAGLDDAVTQDLKESLNLTLPVSNTVWPPRPPELVTAGAEYYRALLRLSSDLMRLFALALHLPEDWFDDKIDHPRTILRLLNYPPVPAESGDGTTRAGAHTDYGTLTILWSPDSRGLQARNRQGEWVDVITPPENLIINIGDLMMNWTNDRWVSTLHQVSPHPETAGKRRQSIPFFHNPNPDALIECIPTCVTAERPAKYRPILAKTHLEMKISKSLGQNVKI